MSCVKPLIVRMGPQFLRPRKFKDETSSLPSSTSVSKDKQYNSMGLEYLALVDVASDLGTYQLNRNAPPIPLHTNSTSTEKPFHPSAISSVDENVREEAELLWKFATSSPSTEETEEESDCTFAPISPSLSFEAKRQFHSSPGYFKKCHNKITQIEQQVSFNETESDQCSQKQTYNLTFPSLSLTKSIHTNIVPAKEHISTPEQLFSRPITNTNAKLSAETIARNIMQSFLKAIDWRSKIWAKSLSDCLHNEFEMKTGYRNGNEPKNIGIRQVGSKEEHQIVHDCVAESAKISPSKIAILNQCILKSNKARVLQAIVHAASSVVLHDVRTTFQVLEQQLVRTSSMQGDDTKKSSNYGRPPPKKRKTNRYNEKRYRLSHAINMETSCTVSTKCKKYDDSLRPMTVVLQASGNIHGTFYRSNDGDVKLVSVVVELDTQELALSMEKNSRLVVRTAAHNHILNPPTSDPHDFLMTPNLCETVSDDSSEAAESQLESEKDENNNAHYSYHKRVHTTSTDAPMTPYSANQHGEYPEVAMITPLKNISRSSSESEDMPPPAPRLPSDRDLFMFDKKSHCMLHPRSSPPVVLFSPQNDAASKGSLDSFASPIPTESATNLTMGSSEQSSYALSNNIATPFLVSPQTPSYESDINQRFLNPRVAPSLPALIEVACAEHAYFN